LTSRGPFGAALATPLEVLARDAGGNPVSSGINCSSPGWGHNGSHPRDNIASSPLPFMAGGFEKPESGIDVDLREMRSPVEQSTIIVTRCPAYGSLDEGTGESHAGSHAVGKPASSRGVRAHIHGHIQRCLGRSEHHFNVRSGDLVRGVVIDLPSLEQPVIDDNHGAAALLPHNDAQRKKRRFHTCQRRL